MLAKYLVVYKQNKLDSGKLTRSARTHPLSLSLSSLSLSLSLSTFFFWRMKLPEKQEVNVMVISMFVFVVTSLAKIFLCKAEPWFVECMLPPDGCLF